MEMLQLREERLVLGIKFVLQRVGDKTQCIGCGNVYCTLLQCSAVIIIVQFSAVYCSSVECNEVGGAVQNVIEHMAVQCNSLLGNTEV